MSVDNIIVILGSCFLLTDCLLFGERGSFEIGRSRSRGWKNFGRRWTWGMEGLKIGQFLYTPYVYHPICSLLLVVTNSR